MTYKRFSEWIILKKSLDAKQIPGRYINKGEIWWASIGENIGVEMNGKNREFSRPVIIMKKLTREFYLAIPTSTKIKYGSWYVYFKHKSKCMVACLQQIRTIDAKRLHSKLGELAAMDFSEIKEGFRKLYRSGSFTAEEKQTKIFPVLIKLRQGGGKIPNVR